VATINAARVLTVTARMRGVDSAGLSRLALAAPAGADGLTLLPYLDGERSPNRPGASGVLTGLTSRNTTQENLARAAVEAVLCSLADAIDMLGSCGITARRVILIGGAARSEAVRAIAPTIFGVPVTVPAPFEYVALGAARQAAWAASGSASPPSWPPAGPGLECTGDPVLQVRERYAALRDATLGWGEASSAGGVGLSSGSGGAS
jgi:xylulokinase